MHQNWCCKKILSVTAKNNFIFPHNQQVITTLYYCFAPWFCTKTKKTEYLITFVCHLGNSFPLMYYIYTQGPDSQKVSSLRSESWVSNLTFFLDFCQIGIFCSARIHKRSEAKIFFSDLVSNLRLPRW